MHCYVCSSVSGLNLFELIKLKCWKGAMSPFFFRTLSHESTYSPYEAVHLADRESRNYIEGQIYCGFEQLVHTKSNGMLRANMMKHEQVRLCLALLLMSSHHCSSPFLLLTDVSSDPT